MKKKTKKRSWCVYMVECVNQAIYTGISNDVVKRVDTHNKGKGARYTRIFGPVKLIYQEKKRSISSALKREREIKKMPRGKKLALIKKTVPR